MEIPDFGHRKNQEPGTCFPLLLLVLPLRFAPRLHCGVTAAIRAMKVYI